MRSRSGVPRPPIAEGWPRSWRPVELGALTPAETISRIKALPLTQNGEPEAVEPPLRRRGFAALTLGAVGVVFGDIATSPLYALREALAYARPVGPPHIAVLGVVSLILWTLTLIVTVKYIAFLMRADNKR